MRNGPGATVHFLLLLQPDNGDRKTRAASALTTTAIAEIVAPRTTRDNASLVWIGGSFETDAGKTFSYLFIIDDDATA